MGESKAEKIRILRIVSRMNIGGIASLTSNLSHFYENSSQFEHLLVYGRCINPEREFPKVKDIRNRVCVETLGREINLLKDFSSAIKILRIIRSWKPHLIETHAFKAGFLIWLLNPFLEKRILTIHHFHGHLLTGYFGQFARSIYILIERIAARKKTLLTVDNINTKRDLLIQKIGIENQYRVIMPGVEAPATETVRTRDKLRKVSFVGRLVAVKSPESFVEIAHLVQADNPDIEFEIVGEGPLELNLRELIQRLGAKVRIKSFSDDLYVEILSSVDLIVMTSLNEGSPLIVQQANLSGIPVIATPVGGIPEMIIEGVNGYCECSVEDIALRIKKISDDDKLIKNLSLGAQFLGAEGFRIMRYLKDHENIVKSLSM